jgi:hypothetical protein
MALSGRSLGAAAPACYNAAIAAVDKLSRRLLNAGHRSKGHNILCVTRFFGKKEDNFHFPIRARYAS